eukprot:jgi/Botrbrau1/201/Bobra.0022s0181.1
MAERLLVGGAIGIVVGGAVFLHNRKANKARSAAFANVGLPYAQTGAPADGLTLEQARVILNNRAAITSHIAERRNLLLQRGASQLAGYLIVVLGVGYIHAMLSLVAFFVAAVLFYYTFLKHFLAQLSQAKDMERSFQEAEEAVNQNAKAAPSPFNGTWKKDRKASESMDKVMDLMQVNPFVRRAIVLMNGVRLKHTKEEFGLSVLTVIPGYVISERYPTDGSVVKWKRRDLRKGLHDGWGGAIGKRADQGEPRLGRPEGWGGRRRLRSEGPQHAARDLHCPQPGPNHRLHHCVPSQALSRVLVYVVSCGRECGEGCESDTYRERD